MDNNLKEIHQHAADLYRQASDNHAEAANYYGAGDKDKGNYFAQIAQDKVVEVKKYWDEKNPNSQLTKDEVELQKEDTSAAKKEVEGIKKEDADDKKEQG